MKDCDSAKCFSNDQLVCMKEFYKLGFRFIARDKFSTLNVYKHMPDRKSFYWKTEDACCSVTLPIELFPQVLWKDEYPICFSDYIDI